jgi:hypothetical protein
MGLLDSERIILIIWPRSSEFPYPFVPRTMISLFKSFAVLMILLDESPIWTNL